MKKLLFTITVLAMLLAMAASACAPAQPPAAEEPTAEEPAAEEPVAEEPAAEEPAVEEPAVEEPAAEESAAEEPVMEDPTEVNIVAFLSSTAEDPWSQALIQSANRVVEESYHDLDVKFDFVENVAFPDVERIGREYAKSGDADILIFHTSYIDAVNVLREEFPDQLMVITTSVYDDHKGGSNEYWWNASPVHEASYLCGVLAGLMSDSNTIGIVASFPVDSVNLPSNAFIDGAKSVNSDVQVKMSYIESWFDPAKSREAAETQINAGADVIFALTFGPFEAAAEHDGAFGIGIYIDQIYLAPEVVLTSPIAFWDPRIKFMIDEWWEYEVNGTPYSSPDESIQFSLAEGGNDIGPFNEDLVPQEVIDQVMEIRQQIVDGEIVIESKTDPIESD